MTEQEFLAFIDANGFRYQRVEHPAVSTKNLFLCDKKARRFFALTGHTPHFFEGG